MSAPAAGSLPARCSVAMVSLALGRGNFYVLSAGWATRRVIVRENERARAAAGRVTNSPPFTLWRLINGAADTAAVMDGAPAHPRYSRGRP